jgi:phage tail P2-like protein
MADRADQSLLPGAPTPTSTRPSTGVYAIDLAASRLGHVPVEIDKLWDADECPASLLPWLAWAVSVDRWDVAWTEEEKRQALRDNLDSHRLKGTKQSVLNVLADAGYPNAKIREGINQFRYDGTFKYNAVIAHQSIGHWAYYTIVLAIGDPAPDSATLNLIDRTAPVRSRLYEIVYE